jgi:hypothetical protein
MEAVRILLNSRQFHEELLRRILVVSDRNADLTPQTHPNSRIVAVAERFGAMVRGRNYRAAFMPDAAVLAMSRMAGKVYDSDVIQLFLSTVGLYPPGTCVELNSGETAVVFHPPGSFSDYLRPVVRICKDAAGDEVYPPPIVDLAAANSMRQIVRSASPTELGVSVSRVLAADEPILQTAQ